MPGTTTRRWEELDEPTRRERETQYLKELSMMSLPGLTEEGVRAYLDYRHERPEVGITTFEEGKIRRLLHRFVDETRIPDPVLEEQHTGRLENFGATRLHLTNSQIYVAIMVTLNFLFLIVLLLFLM
jgi:hypothetical protein